MIFPRGFLTRFLGPSKQRISASAFVRLVQEVVPSSEGTKKRGPFYFYRPPTQCSSWKLTEDCSWMSGDFGNVMTH